MPPANMAPTKGTTGTELKICPLDTTLTPRAFFRIYQDAIVNLGNKATMELAYEEVVDFCQRNNLCQAYSSFKSFKNAYYNYINNHQSKIRRKSNYICP